MAFRLLEYRDRYGHFPPTSFTGTGTEPLQSWRTLLFNYIEVCNWNVDFGKKYNLGQPWNSPGNLVLATPTPKMFVCQNNQGEPHRYTNYVAIIDRGVSSLELADAIPQGSPKAALQVLLIEYPNSDILWTEPRDLDLDDLSRLYEGADPHGLCVVFADCHYRRVSLVELRKLCGR